MRNVLAAAVCLVAAALFAPDARASEAQPAAPPAAEEEAPVDPIAVLHACQRRVGPRRGPVAPMSRRCREAQMSAGAEARLSYANAEGSSGCAPYLAYRGHRRIYVRPTQCRPLFT